MAEYDPPIYDVPVFNPAFFINEDEITKGYLRANFLEFPIGQGLETLPDLRIENDKINLGLSTVAGTNSIAIGNTASTSTNSNAVAIGNGASSVGFSTALGQGSNASGGGSLSCGVGSTSSGLRATAIGRNTIASGESSIALGDGAVATAADEIQLGTSASKLNLEGRLNLNNSGTTSLITYGSAIKLYRKTNGLTIGNYGEFAVNVADLTAEPTSVPIGPRAGINVIYIDDEGNTFLGNSNNNKTMNLRSSNQRTYLNGYSTTGTLSIGGSRFIISSSDRRLKENIETYDEPSIEKIMKLKPAYYNWIDDKSKKKELGFIAQDVETIIPEAVDGKKYEYEWKIDDKGEAILDASGNLQFTDQVRHRGFSDRPLICVLVKAVQEQQEEINKLKERISFLNV